MQKLILFLKKGVHSLRIKWPFEKSVSELKKVRFVLVFEEEYEALSGPKV